MPAFKAVPTWDKDEKFSARSRAQRRHAGLATSIPAPGKTGMVPKRRATEAQLFKKSFCPFPWAGFTARCLCHHHLLPSLEMAAGVHFSVPSLANQKEKVCL